jgi:amino acid adenylation domain-containing protein
VSPVARHLGLLPEAAAARGEASPAVVLDGATRTYGDLVAQSARIAGALAALGVRPRDRVALLARKSVPAVDALYGILRAGAAYVPLDPSAPPARHAAIVRDAGARVVVGEAALVRALVAAAAAGGGPAAAILLDDVPADRRVEALEVIDPVALAGFDGTRATAERAAGDLAYLLYTSGSTGTPKGVMLTHGNALSFAAWAAGEFGLVAADRVANHAPFHFDLSTFDYFASALVGAAVYPVPAREAPFPASVAERTARDRHSVVYATPSTWIQLLVRGKLETRDLSALRVALYAGEVFPPASLARFLAALPEGAACWNLYGPTETNVCTFARVTAAPREGEPASIGHACPNCDVVAVDDAGRVAGPGGEGELHVGGETVMQGYWNDAERTARALVPHPADPARGPVYRTGDLVRVAADGSFRFLGRRDHQVKVRGYRVELGEIESVLAADPDVAEAVVVALPDPEHGAALHAVVLLAPGSGRDERELRRVCAARLPHYMVPASIAVRDAFPRTSSGKIDRMRLAEELASPAPTPKEA